MRQVERDVVIRADDVEVAGTLALTESSRGVVLFAHGSGSSRFSPRNQFVAARLRDEGFGTLLMDLLTESEERIDARTAALRFDIDFLARRVVAAIDWLAARTETEGLAVGCFGASTGAAAALVAAAQRPDRVGTVVSRGGRPDLAAAALPRVGAPTLLIVGGADEPVIEMNRSALAGLASAELVIVPGATHLFEEEGALEEVARLAAAWFVRFLT